MTILRNAFLTISILGWVALLVGIYVIIWTSHDDVPWWATAQAVSGFITGIVFGFAGAAVEDLRDKETDL